MDSTEEVPIPDFVVLGGRSGDKFILMASLSLKSADISYENEWREDRYIGFRYRHPPSTTTTMTAVFEDYTIVIADSYGEAWQELFGLWSPEPQQQKEIENGTQEVEEPQKQVEG